MKKKLLLFVMLLLIGTSSALAADHEPIARFGRQWVYYNRFETSDGVIYTPTVYEFKGDTLIEMPPGTQVPFLRLCEDEYRFVADEDADNQWGGYIVHTNHQVALAHSSTSTGIFYVTQNLSYYPWPLVGVPDGREFDGYGYMYIVYFADMDIRMFFNHVEIPRGDLYRLQLNELSKIDIGGVECDCWHGEEPYRKWIDGLGFLQTNWEVTDDGRYISFLSFFNLNVRNYPQYSRVLSHVVDNGSIVFKGELYDFFAENGFDPAAGGIPVIEE